MSRIGWWMVDALAGLLPAEERAMVRGDIEEMRESCGAALRDVLGLVARRQAQWWMADSIRWWPVIVVVNLFVIRLSLYARDLGHVSAIYAWMYLNNWTPLYVDGAAWRQDLFHYIAVFLLYAGQIALFSAGSGVAIRLVSRRAWALNGSVFCLVLSSCAVAICVQSRADGASAQALYHMLLPLTAEAALVAVPAVGGIRLGRHFERRCV